ncbi:HSP20-like chaperone, partial [Syncephalis pseudoplumigaleata]
METVMSRAINDFWSAPRMLMRRGEDMLGGGGEAETMRNWSPAVDVCDEPNRMVVQAELPGVKKEDIKLELTENGLQISGETKHQAEYNRENVQYSERRFGKFVRNIPLPKSVDGSQAKAKFENGVL